MPHMPSATHQEGRQGNCIGAQNIVERCLNLDDCGCCACKLCVCVRVRAHAHLRVGWFFSAALSTKRCMIFEFFDQSQPEPDHNSAARAALDTTVGV
jgi:hypothetical protein